MFTPKFKDTSSYIYTSLLTRHFHAKDHRQRLNFSVGFCILGKEGSSISNIIVRSGIFADVLTDYNWSIQSNTGKVF